MAIINLQIEGLSSTNGYDCMPLYQGTDVPTEQELFILIMDKLSEHELAHKICSVVAHCSGKRSSYQRAFTFPGPQNAEQIEELDDLSWLTPIVEWIGNAVAKSEEYEATVSGSARESGDS